MSKRDFVSSEYYAKHLHGDTARFNNNTASTRTALIQRMYMRILTEMATNRFKWTGLPDSVDPRFLELTLFYRALSVFYFDKDFDKFFALQGGAAGELNMMNNPTWYFVTGNAFVSKRLSAFPQNKQDDKGFWYREEAECVPIWANYLRVPDLDIVMIYAHKLAEADISIEINVKNARRPKVIAVDENQRLSATNITRQIDEGNPLIQISSNGGMSILPTALDLGIDPDAIEKLSIVRTRLWNECMGLLGINNANQDKKERLVESEVGANDDQIQVTKDVNLNARKLAAYQINQRYGLAVDVCYNTDIEMELNSTIPGTNLMGATDNEELEPA